MHSNLNFVPYTDECEAAPSTRREPHFRAEWSAWEHAEDERPTDVDPRLRVLGEPVRLRKRGALIAEIAEDGGSPGPSLESVLTTLAATHTHAPRSGGAS